LVKKLVKTLFQSLTQHTLSHSLKQEQEGFWKLRNTFCFSQLSERIFWAVSAALVRTACTISWWAILMHSLPKNYPPI
jgi:hypothetical protein